MRVSLLTAIIAFGSYCFSQSERADIIVQYEGANVELTLIGNTGNSIVDPQDLEFHPDLSKNELWVVNKGTESSGSHTVTFSNTGLASQTSLAKADENNWHFMSLTTGLAFSEDNYNWATSPGVWDANHDGGAAFTGPALWSSDMSIYAEPSGGNGSHLDMLHASSYCQGIAWETENVFWVFDGYIGDLVRYDFADDHGPGNSYHDDGRIRRFGGLDLVRDPEEEVVSHLVIDEEKKWLYAVDHGNDRVIRLDITSGTPGGSPSYGPFEVLAEYVEMDDFVWEEVITTGLDEPAGIAIINNKLLVSDHANGDIIVYQTEGPDAFDEWFRIETDDPGINGIEIGPDGRIFYVNEYNNKVRRIDAPTLALPENTDVELNTKLYPNPSTDYVTISANTDLSESEITVYSLEGKSIDADRTNTNGTVQLDVSGVEKGIYLINVTLGSSHSQMRLIVE